MLVVVDLTDPRHPVALSALALDESASDVVIKDNIALVATPTKTELIDIQDATHPTQIGIIAGIGGRLSVNGFLFGTAGGGSSGLHIAALGALAYVRSFDPKLIVVSAGNEIFSNVTINYAVIPPDPDIQSAEVHIDVQRGGRVATLTGPLNSGKGSVLWPNGTVVNSVNPYFATVHAQASGGELPTVQTRVPLMRVPIAVTSRDRMLRVQFALPDQKLFVDKSGNPLDKFTVKVFLNSDGSGSPAISLTSDQINQAYDNEDVWFDDLSDGSSKVAQRWVTRKINQIADAAGVINPIKMQAFEIGTVLSGPTPVFIDVEGEISGKKVSTKLLAQEKADGDWSQVIDVVEQKINSAPPASGTALAENGGLLFRVLHALELTNL